MKVHYVENEKIKVAFFPESKRFFRVNSQAIDLIEALVQKRKKEDILLEFKIDEEMYQKYCDNVFGISEKKENERDTALSGCTKKILRRLVIHLTNDCNMRCQYCYANGGLYGSDRDMMSKTTLDKVVNSFFNEFDIIEGIQFFGGEPLMNLPLLEYACKKISRVSQERGYKIGFGIVTNGTLIDNDFIDLVKKYDLQVTLSYDGHPKINDIMRIMEDGTGSSGIILKNAKALKKETGQPNTIEVTYNRHHVEQGISISEVVNHIYKEIPNTYVHLVPAGGSDKCDYSIENLGMFADSMHEIIKKKKDGQTDSMPMYSLAQRIFSALENQNTNIPNICDAGFGTISVSTKGNVYPCFMFTDNEDMCYGNVNDQNFFTSEVFNQVGSRLNAFSVKDNNPTCKECFIKSLCNGCLGLNSFHSGSPYVLSDKICNMFRDMTDQALLEYAELQSAQEKL